MLKKLSAALIVASMLAAPAMAAGLEKTAPAPITRPVAAADAKLQAKPAVLNANAKMVRHHPRHVRHHHRFHKKMGMNKTFKHTAIKSTVKHTRHG
jgi:lipoate synthase